MRCHTSAEWPRALLATATLRETFSILSAIANGPSVRRSCPHTPQRSVSGSSFGISVQDRFIKRLRVWVLGRSW
jgi:hypothetical protein